MKKTFEVNIKAENDYKIKAESIDIAIQNAKFLFAIDNNLSFEATAKRVKK